MTIIMPNRAETTMQQTEPTTIRSLRASGEERFLRLGYPSVRDESWRFTNTESISRTQWTDRAPEAAEVDAEAVRRFLIPELDSALLVFVDGEYREELSDVDGLGAGVFCQPMPEALGNPAVAEHLGRLSRDHEDGFSALNDARFSGGVAVVVEAGFEAARPIHVLSLSSGCDEPVAMHSRVLVVAGCGARVQVVEQYAGLQAGSISLTNAVTEIFAAEDAFVEHYLLERESESAFNISTLFIEQGAQSRVHSHTVLLGGRVVRNNVIPVLAGEGAHCLINGLYVGHGDQHLDNAMRVRHAAPNCESRQYYKGIMNDRSRGVFTGRIIVDKCAQKTDAIQTNRNMLLSDDARVNARPQLEIYADDVRCTHGATTGRVDDEAVFYFMSRGLSEPVARAMLVYAFAAEGFERMELLPVRRLLAAEMIAKLPKAQGLSIEV